MNIRYGRIHFRMCNFWLSTKYCRFDRDWFFYGLKPQRQMWRNVEGTYFSNAILHVGMIGGINSKVYVSPFRIKHYGYSFREEMVERTRVYRLTDPVEKNQYKYDSGDPDSEMNKSNILLYPFIEFDNKALNWIYIIFYNQMCKTLEALVKLKRKYLSRFKVFPGEVK